MTALSASWRTVRVSVERLRIASKDALASIAAAGDAGIPIDTLLMGLREEFEDWDKRLGDMQLIGEVLAATGSRTRIDALVLVDDPLATREEMIRYEEDQGFLAYHSGKRLRDNPYPISTPAAVSWHNGWMHAKVNDA